MAGVILVPGILTGSDRSEAYECGWKGTFVISYEPPETLPRVLDIATLGVAAGLPTVVRIAEEASTAHYRCHPSTWAITQVTVQITMRGLGRCWPEGLGGAARDIPQGHALLYANRLHRRLVYGRAGPQVPWDFLYINLRGEIATLAIRDLAALHHHVLPLPLQPALLTELQGALSDQQPHQVWTQARSSGLALRLLAALAGVGDARPTAPADLLVAQAMGLLTSDRSLQAVAAACGVSREHLSRLFTRRTGESPGLWRRKARMAEAARRLLAGEAVATVAAACGHADAGHFAAVFRSVTGLSPSAFRRAGGLPGWG